MYIVDEFGHVGVGLEVTEHVVHRRRPRGPAFRWRGHLYVYTYIHTYTLYVYVYMCIYIYINIYTYTHIYTCVCICTCVYICICLYTQYIYVHPSQRGSRARRTPATFPRPCFRVSSFAFHTYLTECIL